MHSKSRTRTKTRTVRNLFVVGLAATVITCSGLDNFAVESEATTTIPRGSILDDLVGAVTFGGFQDFDITQSQEFENQGYSKDQVDSVVLTEFALVIRNPGGANFDFIDRISFSVEADGLPPTVIAQLDPVPEGQTTLQLELLDVELQPYVVAPTMTITTDVSGRNPPDDTTIDGTVAFDVDVNVGGVIGCQIGR